MRWETCKSLIEEAWKMVKKSSENLMDFHLIQVNHIKCKIKKVNKQKNHARCNKYYDV
jgi:hypothetical protein